MSRTAPSQLQCPICLDTLHEYLQKVPVATQCGHIFCTTCLSVHRNTSSVCPTCRTLITCVIRLKSGDASENTTDVPLDHEAISCLERLASVTEHHARGAPITCDTFPAMLKMLHLSLNALESSVNTDQWQDSIDLLKVRRDFLRSASLKFQEDRVVISQFNRWSTLLHADQTTLSTMERRISRGYRQRAELHGEKETIMMELNDLGMRTEVQAAQHDALVERLRRRLQGLQRDS